MKTPEEFSSLGNPISRHSVRLSSGLDILVISLVVFGLASVVMDVGRTRAVVAGATLSRGASQGMLVFAGIMLLATAGVIVAMTTKRARSLLVIVGDKGFGTKRKSLAGSKVEIYPWNEIQQVARLDKRCSVRRSDGTEESLSASLPRYDNLVEVLSQAAKAGYLPANAGERLATASALQPLSFVLVFGLGLLGVLHPVGLIGTVAVAIVVTVLRNKHRIDKNVVVALWALVGVFALLLSVVWLK